MGYWVALLAFAIIAANNGQSDIWMTSVTDANFSAPGAGKMGGGVQGGGGGGPMYGVPQQHPQQAYYPPQQMTGGTMYPPQPNV